MKTSKRILLICSLAGELAIAAPETENFSSPTQKPKSSLRKSFCSCVKIAGKGIGIVLTGCCILAPFARIINQKKPYGSAS